jgi:MFS superfamily sulfate permease-like transporter
MLQPRKAIWEKDRLTALLFTVRGLWRQHFLRFFWLLQFLAILLVLYWWKRLPAPGYAIGALAFLTVVMTLQGEIGKWQKAFPALIAELC